MLAVPRQRMQAMKLPWAFMLCALMATPTLSQEPTQPRMQWLMGSQPLDPQGRPIASPGQALVEFMKKAWPEVHHEILYANGKRSMQLLMDGEPACHVALVRTLERERQLLFTTTVLMPPPSVIVRRDSLARLPRDTQGAVDLPALLRHPTFKGALVSGRSYGKAIDPHLQRAAAAAPNTMSYFSPNDFGGKVLLMLQRKRVDFTSEYEWILDMMNETGQSTKQLLALPIQGAMALSPSGIACPRTAWGRAAMRGIDKALSTPAGAAMLRESFMPSLSPALQARYGSALDAFYKRRALGRPDD